MKRIAGFALIWVLALVSAPGAWAQDEKPVAGFPDLVRRSVTFWSDGTMLAGDLTYPKDVPAGETLPAIVLCHGWGGIKAHLNFQIAPRFAREGYVVFTFDYRGWGESNSRLVMMDKMPAPDADGNVTVTARAVRELVDPLDQQEDIDAALTFIEGEPMVDTDRIGIWGSSFGGGHVIWRAANDPRVKCVVAQVGAMDQRGSVLATYAEQGREISPNCTQTRLSACAARSRPCRSTKTNPKACAVRRITSASGSSRPWTKPTRSPCRY
jgi:dienelactone hydrolase